jgi:uncharacterized protein YkwD
MKSLTVLMLCAALALSACAAGGTGGGTAGGRAYVISPQDTAEIQFKTLDSVNTLRQARGMAPMALNAQLNAAAATHSRDMAVQNRPWHFGSDGSSPLVRVQRVGYTGRFLGEAISESNDTELETLSAWMDEPATRQVIMEPAANEMGIAWYQEPTGKIWWTLVTGSSSLATPIAATTVALPRG